MSDYVYEDLFTQDSIDKQLLIDFDWGRITNHDLHSEEFEITESICSEPELRFGGCESSCVKFRVSNIFTSLKNTEINISMVLNGKSDNPFVFGHYKVYSDIPTADRQFRDIVAYDKMYEIINTNVADWYNSLTFPMTLREFRAAFVNYFGLEEADVELINDGMIIEKTIETSELSGKDVAYAICEINGCFGHINRNNQFDYIKLYNVYTTYPSDDLYPEDILYPSDGKDAMVLSKSQYMSCQYEDFETQYIDSVVIQEGGEDIGNAAGKGNNAYIINDNFLLYGKNAEDLEIIKNNFISVVSNIKYRPATIHAKGNPSISVGESVRLNTNYQIIFTYILSRTLTGINGLRDIYVSEGVEKYEGDLNSSKSEIKKLKSRTNKLIRTVEETKSEIENVESGLKTIITQTEKALKIEIKNAEKVATSYLVYDEENGLQVGEVSNGEWNSFRAQIKAGVFNVLDNAGLILSSFGSNLVELGKNSSEAIIKLCGGLGSISYGITDKFSINDSLKIKSDNVEIIGENASSLYHSYVEDYSSEGGLIKGGKSFARVARDNVQIHSEHSENLTETNGMLFGESDYSEVVVDPYSIYGISKRIDLYGEEGIFLNNYQFGENVVLWSGSKKMVSSDTIDLAFPISQQAHGIVLIFSYYTNNEAQNYNFFDFFVPKHIIEYATGRGHYFSGLTPGGAISKYLYLGNKSITGADANDVDTASPHNVLNSRYVLRFVIGV